MSTELTFLKAQVPLTKTISKGSVTNYPLVKNFTSTTETIETIAQFGKAITKHANAGDCLLKGELIQPLEDESRAGKTNRSAPSSWLLLDIDGYKTETDLPKLTAANLEKLAKNVLKKLPELFQNTSFVVQASAGLGTKPKEVNIHLFFLLDRPLVPQITKQFLTNMNLLEPEIEQQLELTKTGFDVKYKIDRCVADNSRLIFIAPPVFEKGMGDPVKKRIITVKNYEEKLESSKIEKYAGKSIIKPKKEAVARLRKKIGLKANIKERTMQLKINGSNTALISNPEKNTLIYSYSDRGFCYYNLGGGDSNGYYHPEGKPDIIYNFKGELPFRWVDVDETGYLGYLEANQSLIEKKNPIKYFGIISKQDDNMYKVEYNTATKEVITRKSSALHMGHFYRENGLVMPETIDEWSIGYDPKSPLSVDSIHNKINTYIPSVYINDSQTLDITPKISSLKSACPTIFKLLDHVCNSANKERDYFINWLAYVMQFKEKPNTCWFFWGAQGTGKGLLYNHVLKPIFGASNTSMHRGATVEDNFDAWRENKQLIVIDEFELPKGINGMRALEKIKSWVAEEDASMRAMYKIAEVKKSIESYIFFSNKFQMIKVEEGERRFNIAPRQERSITTRKFFDPATITTKLEAELQTFTNLLLNLEVNKTNARVALNNEAKRYAHDASISMAESFCAAIRNGDLEAFIDIMYFKAEDEENIDDQLRLKDVQGLVRQWIIQTHENKEPVMVTAKPLAKVFQTMTGMPATSASIGKMLNKNGVFSIQATCNKQRGRYFKIRFNEATNTTPKELLVLQRAAPGTRIVEADFVRGAKT